MFFADDDEPEIRRSNPIKLVYIYENGVPEQKPLEFRLQRKKTGFKDIMREIGFKHLRLFNSEGAQYFEDDLEFVKNGAVLYASHGEDFDPSSCFGEYVTIKKLGEGGFGQVHLAEHKQTGERFAIKIIRTDKLGSAADIDNIFVEAEVLKTLKHDNIVKVHNCLTLKNMKVAIIMEYLEGGQLLQFVEKEERLSEEQAKIFIRQIAKAMNYCHLNGLIHRDLKLQNMLLVNKEQSKIKIIDFGIAGVMKLLTWEDLDIGSLGYMAPQCFVVSKDYQIDGRIDVWATGIIMFAMLCGELPFKGGRNQQVIEMIKQGKYKINPKILKQISPECLDAMQRCLDVNPKTRITMEELLQHPWLSNKKYLIEEQKIIKEEETIVLDKIVEEKKKPKSSIIMKNKKKSGK